MKNREDTPGPDPDTDEGTVITPPLEDREGEEGPIANDTRRSNGDTRRKRDTLTQHEDNGTNSMEHDVPDTPCWSGNDENQVYESETYSLPSIEDETRSRQQKPKTHKKMKTERTTDSHIERSRSLPRRRCGRGVKPE